MTEAAVPEIPTLKPFMVQLRMPVEAVSMTAAVESFLADAAAQGWVFQITTPEGVYMVDTNIQQGNVQKLDVLYFTPAGD